MKTNSWNILIVAFALFFSQLASAQGVSTCLQKAARLGDPGSRDRAKLICLKKNPQLTFQACLTVARGFEYSGMSESAVRQCLFGQNADLTARQCVQATRALSYGMSRDEVLWNCLDQLGLSLKNAECRSLARAFIYPHNRNRAVSYCENEITNAR